MKIIILLLIIFSFSTGCKRNNNIYNSNEYNNIAETNMQYTDEKIIDDTIFHENNPSAFVYDLPFIMSKDDNTFLQFPNSYIINISENYREYKIDYVRIYYSNSKESQYIEVKNEDVLLFKLPGKCDWLYCYVSDFMHGYLYVYDISKESFYGNFDINRESGNYYRTSLIVEYELLNNYSNVKRYGPLLEIKYNNNVIRFWDSFPGNKAGRHRYLLLDYYEKYNEILLVKQLWEGTETYIYNIQSAEYVCEIDDTPYFNESRDAVCSFVYGYGDPGVSLKLFLIKDGVYEKVFYEDISLRYISSKKGFWINNDEFHIEYIEKNYDYDSDKMKEKKVVLLVSRKNPKYKFEIIKK